MADAGPSASTLSSTASLIAIRGDFLDHQAMAGGFALQPQLVAGAAVKRREAGLHRLPKGFFIHEADHQDAAAHVILNDRGDQPVEFAEIEFHICAPKKKPAVVRGGLLTFEKFRKIPW